MHVFSDDERRQLAVNLRDAVRRAWFLLGVRHGLGIAMVLVGTFVVTRLIGPKEYGLYAAAVDIQRYGYTVFHGGLGIYLVRKQGDLARSEVDHVFTLLAGVSAAVAGSLLLAIPALTRWIGMDRFPYVALPLFLGLPVALLTLVPTALLERNLDYRGVAIVELGGQGAGTLVSVALALLGSGVWAPVCGTLAQQTLSFSLAIGLSRYKPRLRYHPGTTYTLLRHATSFSVSMWLWQLRSLINPLIVGRYLGAEAVGYVALAVRVVDSVTFLRTPAWRLSISALSRLRDNRHELALGLGDAARLHALILVPEILVLAGTASWAVPALFGKPWSASLQLIPFVAGASLIHAVFIGHSAALYVLGRNLNVFLFHALHVALFAGTALVLIPKLGLVAYGWAEFATLPAYALLHNLVARCAGPPRYGLLAVWCVATVLPLFWCQLGAWVWFGPVAALCWPGSLREIVSTLAVFRGAYVTHG